jgi:hypothetical protein
MTADTTPLPHLDPGERVVVEYDLRVDESTEPGAAAGRSRGGRRQRNAGERLGDSRNRPPRDGRDRVVGRG